jgi:outer membrane protein
MRVKWFSMVPGGLLILLLLSDTVLARQTITLDDAYQRALSRSERIKISRESLFQAREEVLRKKSALYPKITADLSYLQRPKALRRDRFLLRSESETRAVFNLSQPLYTGGRAMARYRSALLSRKSASFGLALTKEDLLFEIAGAYYEALKSKNNVDIAIKELERLKAHLNSAKKRFQVGEVTKMVLFRAEAELSDVRAKLIRARNHEIAMKDRLALLAEIQGDFDLSDPPAVSLPERSKSEWVDLSQTTRLEIKQGEIHTDQANEDILFARGSYYPLISLDLEYHWVDQDPQSDFLIRNDPLALLKLTMPIFEGNLRSAELAQANSRLRETDLIRQQTREEIGLEVREAILQLSSLSGELEHLKNRVRFARTAYSLASRQFDVGLGTHIDVLDASAELLDAERRFSNTSYDREFSILHLTKQVGLFYPFRAP